MNLLDFLIFWFIFFVVVNGTHQGVHRAVLDVAVFFVGVILAALIHPAFGKVLTYVFPEMWAYQIAFAAIAGGFAIAVTKPFDGVLRNDWRLSKLRPQFERVDRVTGGVIAFVLSLMFIHIFALLLLTYPVLRIDDEVRGSFLVPELYARVPKMTGMLPSNFDMAANELDHIQRGSRIQASEPPPSAAPQAASTGKSAD